MLPPTLQRLFMALLAGRQSSAFLRTLLDNPDAEPSVVRMHVSRLRRRIFPRFAVVSVRTNDGDHFYELTRDPYGTGH